MDNRLRGLSIAYALYTLFGVILLIQSLVLMPKMVEHFFGRASLAFQILPIFSAIIGALSVALPAGLSLLLGKHRKRKLVGILAIISCLIFPIGTILGIVTLNLVGRQEIKVQFVE